MSAYDDQPQIQALYAEQALISQALAILEDGGTVSRYTVAPAPPQPGEMSVIITTVDPGQNLIAGIHSNLVQRYNTINQELRNLGVTGGPPDHAGNPHPQGNNQ